MIEAIKLTDNGASLAGEIGTALVLYYPGFQAAYLRAAVNQYTTLHPLKGSVGLPPLGPPQVYIVSGANPPG